MSVFVWLVNRQNLNRKKTEHYGKEKDISYTAALGRRWR